MNESREWPTVELVLNKIVERLEKEEDQMMVVRSGEEKPWRTECLKRTHSLRHSFEGKAQQLWLKFDRAYLEQMKKFIARHHRQGLEVG